MPPESEPLRVPPSRWPRADAAPSPSLQACGLYLLASVGSGLVAAVPCALFPGPVAPLVGSLAGLATSVFLLSTRSDSLIRPVGLRYILVVGQSAFPPRSAVPGAAS